MPSRFCNSVRFFISNWEKSFAKLLWLAAYCLSPSPSAGQPFNVLLLQMTPRLMAGARCSPTWVGRYDPSLWLGGLSPAVYFISPPVSISRQFGGAVTRKKNGTVSLSNMFFLLFSEWRLHLKMWTRFSSRL